MLVKLGSIWFVLFVIHFNDWFFQSQAQAIAKSKDSNVRTEHCAVYTSFFMALFIWVGCNVGQILLLSAWIFWTHWFEDTYVPVMWWAKHLRKATEFGSAVWDPVKAVAVPLTDEEAFKKFASTPVGLLLSITIDQMIHIVSLGPVAWYLAFRI